MNTQMRWLTVIVLLFCLLLVAQASLATVDTPLAPRVDPSGARGGATAATSKTVFLPLVIRPVSTAAPSSAVAAADPECISHCDCPQGGFCYQGQCVADPETPVYCCAKPGCMPGKWCFNPDGSKGVCGEDPAYVCATACDCGATYACMAVPGVGKTCVKDANDPWSPGSSIFGITVPPGEPTYCCTDPICHAGRVAYGSSSGFACYDPSAAIVRDYCTGTPCYYAGDCGSGESCLDTRRVSIAGVGALCSSEGGFCVFPAIAEAVYGLSPSELLPGCSQVGFPGQHCEVGWRPGGSYAVQRVIGIYGSCGNAACEKWESPITCLADCHCGDGVCSGTEVLTGSCAADCGACGDGACRSPETPKNCPADCQITVGDGSCSTVEVASGLLADCGCTDSATYWDYPAMCGDGVCQKGGDIPENHINCHQDCQDATSPVISYMLDPATPTGNNGWYRSDVALTWTVTEAESPASLVKTGCSDQNLVADQDEIVYSCSATSDGGSAGPVEVTIKRDATPPVVTVTGVSDGNEYLLGTAPPASCSTTDALSGVFAKATPSVTGGTAPGVGAFAATCAGAKDYAGNQANDVAVTYSVVFAFTGFFPPINNPPIVNKVKAGEAVPIKFSLAGDQGRAILAAGSPTSVPMTCAAWTPSGAAEETVTAGGSSLSYDAGQYVYVWKTNKTWAGACRQLQVQLIDGKIYTANFQFTKN